MSTAGQAFDPANWQAHYAGVKERLRTVPQKAAPLLVVHDTRHTQPVISLPAFLPKREPQTRVVMFDPVAAQIAWAKSAERLLRAEQAREGLAKYGLTDIRRIVSQRSGVSIDEIDSARRTGYIIIPRQVGMWLCKKLTPRSLPEIGRRFGGRDHTTALHAVRKIEALYQAASLPKWAMTLANQMFATQEPTP